MGKAIKLHSYNEQALDWHSRTWLDFPVGVHAKSLQSCLRLCHTMGCGPPGSSVHEILQARILQ